MAKIDLSEYKKVALDTLGKAKTTALDTKDAVVAKLDADGDGQIGIEDVIIISFKTPGVYIERESFLRKQFFKNHTPEEIDAAVKSTPALAGIPAAEIDKIADECIKSERNKVSGISAALGAPGGAAMVATIPADITQYYGFMLRAAQKLLYLYGFPDIDSDDAKGLQLDEQTMNTIVLCLGTMYGVAGANNAIKAVAKGLANGVSKKIMNTALTKGAVYPFIKEVSKWFGIKMTKSLLAGAVNKAIPVVGGVIGGGLTFATFKPCCDRLKKELKDTLLANPQHQSSKEETEVYNNIIGQAVVDAEFADVVDACENAITIDTGDSENNDA
ncbi:MAG: EcsC family protein [Oscillospiraceae bacterium]|nr:EcsC family protein [Oscillospiraceae bacterium]